MIVAATSPAWAEARVRRDIAERRFRAVLEELDNEIRQQVDLTNTSQFVDYCLDRFYRQAHGMGLIKDY